jgi:AmiR/NasT family two-component response regulator
MTGDSGETGNTGDSGDRSSRTPRASVTPADLAAAVRRRPPAPEAAPAPAPAGARAAASAPAGSPSVAPRKTVVVAEDEALIRLDLTETLGELGYEVIGEAADGRRAVELAQQLRPDLVILDVKMPVLDGISAAERITAERIAPVLILTAFSQRELVDRARDAGAMAYLVKPFSSAELLPAIEMALSRHAQIAALEAEVSDLAERLETRKVIDRAKGVLQAGRGMTEPEAFRWIQRTAMDQRTSMRAVADSVIAATGPDAGGSATPDAGQAATPDAGREG